MYTARSFASTAEYRRHRAGLGARSRSGRKRVLKPVWLAIRHGNVAVLRRIVDRSDTDSGNGGSEGVWAGVEGELEGATTVIVSASAM